MHSAPEADQVRPGSLWRGPTPQSVSGAGCLLRWPVRPCRPRLEASGRAVRPPRAGPQAVAGGQASCRPCSGRSPLGSVEALGLGSVPRRGTRPARGAGWVRPPHEERAAARAGRPVVGSSPRRGGRRASAWVARERGSARSSPARPRAVGLPRAGATWRVPGRGGSQEHPGHGPAAMRSVDCRHRAGAGRPENHRLARRAGSGPPPIRLRAPAPPPAPRAGTPASTRR
jgi:hypothetical protein